MTIQTRDQLIKAMGNNFSRFILDKASISSQAAGTYVSLWRATGQPGQGAIPAATATCNAFGSALPTSSLAHIIIRLAMNLISSPAYSIFAR